jgi:hypothetical protein
MPFGIEGPVARRPTGPAKGARMDERTQRMAESLHEAGAVPHVVYRITDGADDDWGRRSTRVACSTVSADRSGRHHDRGENRDSGCAVRPRAAAASGSTRRRRPAGPRGRLEPMAR